MADSAPLPLAVPGPRGVTRALLELVAEVMEASFHVLGQGVIMGSMPRYVRRFGARNARYIQRTYMGCDPQAGALSALGPINFVSKATGTPFSLPMADASRSVKRLETCEFKSAFADKSDFAKAMVCKLHEAVYEGSVNGLLEDPAKDGYRVSLQRRILFGDPHCDFQVDSVPPRQGPDPGATMGRLPAQEDLASEQHHFYAAILVAFLEYLCQVLPEPDVQVLVAQCADRIGRDLAAELPLDTPLATMAALLRASDRTVSDDVDVHAAEATHGAASTADADVPDAADTPTAMAVEVTQCPFVRPIRGAAKDGAPSFRDAVRRSACGTCTSVLQGTLAGQGHDVSLRRTRCMATGDATCRFEVRP